MPTIDELSPEQIRHPEIFQKIKELGNSFVRCVQAKEAYFLQEKLEILLNASNLQNFNPDLQKQYDNLLVALRWTALPLLPEEKILNVFSNRYLAVLDNEDIDTRERIEAKMFTLDLFPRNELRQKMQRALKENKELLGSKTFGEWLLDYGKAFDFRDRDELTHSNYINQNPETEVLAEPEKNKLRKALQIFDKTMLVTPVMSEPALSMAVMAMMRSGIIDKASINPTLLQAISITAKISTPPAKIPSPTPPQAAPPIPKPVAPPVPTPEPEPETNYKIRTMKEDIETAKKQPIPPRPTPKIHDNIVDLSGK